jgi:glutaredoxin
MAKMYLESRNISYETKDITQDPDAYKEILEKSGQLGVPVIEIEDKIVIGFDRPRIDVLLRESGH